MGTQNIQQPSPFEKTVRRVEGRLDINFFDNGTDNSVEIIGPSHNGTIEASLVTTTNRGLTDNQEGQIFEFGLVVDKKLASFDGGGIPLNGTAHLVGQNTVTGWIGNRRSSSISGREGEFVPPQIIRIRFDSRRLPHWELRGIRARKIGEQNLFYESEYPVNFDLTVFFKDGRVFVDQVRANDNLICRWDFERGFRHGFDFEPNGTPDNSLRLNNNFSAQDFERNVVGVMLQIHKWSKPNVLPRITYFSGEMHQAFDGSSLRSIEVLEEKTGSLDSLSYGISSNYCKASFLNRDKMFYDRQHFNLLRRGRSVVPTIKCGYKEPNEDGYKEPNEYLLGRFFSEEWQIDDSSMFMSVKAYDILYSLQNVDINFGMELSAPNETTWYARPFASTQNNLWTVERVIREVFRLINLDRQKNGIFERIEYDIRPSNNPPHTNPLARNIVLPVVLIEEKSAWDVLQQIASFACSYVYVDRDGTVVIEEDTWAKRHIVVEQPRFPILEQGASYNKVKVAGSLRDSDRISGSNSVGINGLREYDYKAGLFVTNDRQAVPQPILGMVDNILYKYRDGVDFVDAEWKGDADLKLGDKFDSYSVHEDIENNPNAVQTYECLSNEMTLSNGFRQTTKGRVVTKENGLNKSIDPSNSFRYSLPVVSRTIVNQVNFEYYVLEKDMENPGENVSVNWRDCETIAINNEQGQPTGRYTVTATVSLNKVYERISNILLVTDREEIENFHVVSATVSSLNIRFECTEFERLRVEINT